MPSSRNCDLSFSRNEITVVVIEYIDYFLVIIINDSFIHLYISCMYFTDFLYCLYSAWIQARDSASTVQSIPADSGCTVATVCLRVNQSKTSVLASSTRHARSETFNKNSVHSGLFGLLLYFLEFIDGKTQRSHRKSTNVVRMHESDELGIRRPHVTSSYHYVIYMMPSSFIN